MTKFYLAICRNKFYLYDDKCKPVYIDGNPFFEYEANKLRESTFRLMEKLVDENNLSSKRDLKFFVIENNDAVRNESFSKMAETSLAKRFPLNELLRRAIGDLAKNPKLYVGELGVNYDGECYRLEDGRLTANDYSLTAFTIEPAALIKFID